MARDRGNYGPAEDTPSQSLVPQPNTALMHTGGDRDRAIEQISSDFRELSSDLSGWLTANPNHPAANSVAQWIAHDITPTLAEWGEFVAREKKSWWTKLATSWDTFEGWGAKVKQLRALARAHGVTLHSAEPWPLPKTVWEKTAQGNGTEAMAVLGVLKLSALTILGVMGAAGLYGAVQHLRSRVKGVDEHHQTREIVRQELAKKSRAKGT